MSDPAIRPTADSITDDVVDALWEFLEGVEALHNAHKQDGVCMQCMTSGECLTAQLAALCRVRIEESRARAEETDHLA